MSEPNERDSKLIQYLSEAYGKEKELEAALNAHIGMTSLPPYKKRLQQHLRETKGHARRVERRIKQLGGGGQTLQSMAGKAIATAKGPLHALRATNQQERMLKNAKTEYSEEHEEIATYSAIEAFAEKVGDRETAKLARAIRREEERMAGYLDRVIGQLTRAVAQESVPASQRGSSRSSGARKAARTRRRKAQRPSVSAKKGARRRAKATA